MLAAFDFLLKSQRKKKKGEKEKGFGLDRAKH
jgi:hypothetical protein